MIPPQKQMTGMLGHPVAENPIDRMFDAVYAHYGLNWQFWKSDVVSEAMLAPAVAGLAPLGYRGVGITVPYKVAVIPLLDAVDDDVKAIGAANYLTIENGRLIGHNNDGKGVVKAIEKQRSLKGEKVVMLGAGGAGRAMAMEIACLSLRPRSAVFGSAPPITGSSQLKPMYMLDVATEVVSTMPWAFIDSDSVISPALTEKLARSRVSRSLPTSTP